jgi:hypothetical protein
MPLRENAAVIITIIIGVLVLWGLYTALGILQDLGLDPVALLGVIIAFIASVGGLYSYAKSRLDKVVTLLDQVRTWAAYPSVRASPFRSLGGTFSRDNRLQEVAGETARNLAEAWASVSPSLPSKSLVLKIASPNGEIERVNVDISKEIDETLAVLHTFSIAAFTNDKELTEHWERVSDKLDDFLTALGALKEQSYRVRSWIPRWLANKYAKVYLWFDA